MSIEYIVYNIISFIVFYFLVPQKHFLRQQNTIWENSNKDEEYDDDFDMGEFRQNILCLTFFRS